MGCSFHVHDDKHTQVVIGLEIETMQRLDPNDTGLPKTLDMLAH